jgi:RecA-family ATPase
LDRFWKLLPLFAEADFFTGGITTKRIQTITARELYDMKLPPTRYVVDGLLPRGLHVFAGPPKVGKSWLLLQLSLAVASGTSFWGLDTEQGRMI